MQTKNWPTESPKNIIVRVPNWLGDVVMATPVLKDLRNHYKDSKITVMAQANVASLLKNDPHIDEIYSFKRPNGWIHRHHPLEIIDTLRQGKYDLGVLLTNSFSSAWWFCRGNVKNRIGFSGNLRNLLLNKVVSLPPKIETQHQVVTYKMLLDPLGIPVSSNEPKLYISPEEDAQAKELVKELGIDLSKQTIIGINPGAAYGSAKCWLPERYQAVTNRLLQNPQVFIIYFGDAAGTPLVNEICKELPVNRVANLAGKTSIRSLIALINLCSVFLTNDSGPMHIAAALKVPLLALFGSTSDVKTGPSYGGMAQVIHKHVECSPCYKRTCPIDFRCMKRITVDEVQTQIQNLLKNE
jgi:heptosyltransferase-2